MAAVEGAPAVGSADDQLTPVQQYAVKAIADGGESALEDDLDEDGTFADQKDHTEACVLGILLTSVIRNNPADFLRWAQPHLDALP